MVLRPLRISWSLTTYSICRSVVPSPSAFSLPLVSLPKSTMLAWLTSPVSVCPCMEQKGQAVDVEGAASTASASAAARNRRQRLSIISGVSLNVSLAKASRRQVLAHRYYVVVARLPARGESEQRWNSGARGLAGVGFDLTKQRLDDLESSPRRRGQGRGVQGAEVRARSGEGTLPLLLGELPAVHEVIEDIGQLAHLDLPGRSRQPGHVCLLAWCVFEPFVLGKRRHPSRDLGAEVFLHVIEIRGRVL